MAPRGAKAQAFARGGQRYKQIKEERCSGCHGVASSLNSIQCLSPGTSPLLSGTQPLTANDRPVISHVLFQFSQAADVLDTNPRASNWNFPLFSIFPIPSHQCAEWKCDQMWFLHEQSMGAFFPQILWQDAGKSTNSSVWSLLLKPSKGRICVSLFFFLLLFHFKMSAWPYSFNTLFKMLLMCILALPHVHIWGFTPFIMIQIQCNVLCSTLAGSKLGFSPPAKFRAKTDYEKSCCRMEKVNSRKEKQRRKTMILFLKCPIWGL